METSACPVCAAVACRSDLELRRDDHVRVVHLDPAPTAYLGYLFVEPRAHRRSLDEIDDAEAAALGTAVRDTARALRAVGAEHVYSFVVGHQLEHLHVHVVPRWPGAPREFWGVRVDEWPQAPRGDATQVVAFVHRLRDASGTH